MELTVDQALQQGFTAHSAGKLQEAERLYRAILQAQPRHPDANHNLGGIAVSMNMIEVALPLFKIALEVNPKIEQFWISYIDALIQAKQFENAKRALKKATKKGVATYKIDGLMQKLMSAIKVPAPSQSDIQKLLKHYQDGKYDDAEKLAVSLTHQFPYHQFGWKLLGVVLKQRGKISEALIASQKAVELDAKDAGAHNNLGVILKELGRLDVAESNLRRAIVLQPDFAEAYDNLGTTLLAAGRIEDAEASLRRAVVLKPDFAEAHDNLGTTQMAAHRIKDAEASHRKAIALKPDYNNAHYNLGNTLLAANRIEDAEASYRKAIALKPDFAEAHNNLGAALLKADRKEAAEESCRKAIALKPDYAAAYSNLGGALLKAGKLAAAEESCRKAIALKSDLVVAHSNLGSALLETGNLVAAEESLKKAIALTPDFAEAFFLLSEVQNYFHNTDEQILLLEHILILDKDNYGLKAAVNLAISRFIEDDFSTSKKQLIASSKIQQKRTFGFTNFKVYYNYLLILINWHETRPLDYLDDISDNRLYVIGESHALVSHGLLVQTSVGNFLCKSHLVIGCQQWHLGNPHPNKYKVKFERIIHSLPKASNILLTIGEIDCRLDGGIIKHNNKYPEKNRINLIMATVENYLNYILKINSSYKHNITIQGVPCPNINITDVSKEKVKELIDLIRAFNLILKNKTAELGFSFLDVYKITDRGDGFSNMIWHSDHYHLKHEAMIAAWQAQSPSELVREHSSDELHISYTLPISYN
jgi:tetratricopeptide (TPR) repeat protein